MSFEERTVASKEIYEGRILSLREETVVLPSGEKGKRELVSHPGAVAVVVETAEGFVYRKAVEEALWEIPAGKIDPGEEPLAAARRETYEETGFKAGKLTFLTCFYPSPGFCDERIYIYAAEDLKKGEAEPDPDEFLEVGIFPENKLWELLLAGKLCDGKTIAGLLLYFAQKGGSEGWK